MEKTYKMDARCKNCDTVHATEIVWGKLTSEDKTQCDYCGAMPNGKPEHGDGLFWYEQPGYWKKK